MPGIINTDQDALLVNNTIQAPSVSKDIHHIPSCITWIEKKKSLRDLKVDETSIHLVRYISVRGLRFQSPRNTHTHTLIYSLVLSYEVFCACRWRWSFVDRVCLVVSRTLSTGLIKTRPRSDLICSTSNTQMTSISLSRWQCKHGYRPRLSGEF